MVMRQSAGPQTSRCIRVLKSTVCAGRHVKAGQVLENVPYGEWRALVYRGKAEIVADPAPAPAPDTEAKPKRKARAKRKAKTNRMVDNKDLDDRGE
jgi:hypothetical protein